MKITQEYARKVIEEVAPLVEKVSGLKTDLNNYVVIIEKSLNNMAWYSHPKTFTYTEEFLYNDDAFHEITAHEIFHNAIFSKFPNLSDYKNSFYSHSLDCLIEGDATLIQLNLRNKYYKNSNWISSSDALLWVNILNKEFGGNREYINALYTAPIEELVKIFRGDE